MLALCVGAFTHTRGGSYKSFNQLRVRLGNPACVLLPQLHAYTAAVPLAALAAKSSCKPHTHSAAVDHTTTCSCSHVSQAIPTVIGDCSCCGSTCNVCGCSRRIRRWSKKTPNMQRTYSSRNRSRSNQSCQMLMHSSTAPTLSSSSSAWISSTTVLLLPPRVVIRAPLTMLLLLPPTQLQSIP